MRRRDFIKSSAFTGSAWLLPGGGAKTEEPTSRLNDPPPTIPGAQKRLPDLEPARWIWYPSGRCLQNTFILFRRELNLTAQPRRASGWIAADSRYLLEVNGRRIQWGPAPADPRWPEADPLDLTASLAEGRNIIGAQVLFFGQGDGTWPIGKPGFLFWLELETSEGQKQTVVSDRAWMSFLARAWKPGHYKRDWLRALQEEFDARLYPYGWTTSGFTPGQDWLPAMTLDCPVNKAAVCSTYTEYMVGMDLDPRTSELRPRSVPLLREVLVPAARLAESCWIDWKRPLEDYFEFRTPEAFRAERQPSATEVAPGKWQVSLDGARGAALTFEFVEQIVGWPYFTIEAPAGTIVELMVQEAHEVGGPALLNTHGNNWTRFICRDGPNRFETFDYEGGRWLQLHIHDVQGTVTVREVGMRRRTFRWPKTPHIRVSEPALQRLMDASINTLNNCAQETLMDSASGERQQYSGDCGHQIHSIHLALGETRLPARYLATFSQGITLDGYFLDAWPGYCRFTGLVECELGLTVWGPLIDHGVGFNFDCMYHYLYTGDLDALREPYSRLIRFAQYLSSQVGRDGLLPVDKPAATHVWIDHVAYQQQRHKQCAFNLYVAAMLQHALPTICRAFGDRARAESAISLGQQIQAATVRKFWSTERDLFVVNLPWLAEEGTPRLCDRSLATAILYDQCPDGRTEAALRALAECPPEMGFSYPANAGWRLWALGKGGRADVIMKDLRERWANLESVKLNNTLQENWHAKPDGGWHWSHCPVAPLYVAYMSLAGIRPLEPGFQRCEIRPQLADLELLELTAHTVKGPLTFTGRGKRGNREITLTIPDNCAGELVVSQDEELRLPLAAGPTPSGHRRYQLPSGKSITLQLKYT